jgi:hypothetical protein
MSELSQELHSSAKAPKIAKVGLATRCSKLARPNSIRKGSA